MQESSVLSTLAVPIHPEGWRFIPLFAAGSLLLFWLWTPLGWLGVLLTLWCAYFFRNPSRVTPTREGLVISPADGVVQMIVPAPPPLELAMGDAPMTRVSIFMNVFNVHVNRAPIGGRVVKRVYSPGKFFNAALDKASVFNERMAVHLGLADGRDIAFVQIAGLVARRIRCDLVEGQEIRTGERFGLIRFGSRLDVYLPDGVAPLVVVGQTAIAGETVLADLVGTEPERQGETR
ncbi:phosphatidylserine decarboxylase [Telmatospirillum siberiense]|uniref:Phosphatidylserine decarboxylase proenzyme n=1 Tax=Telmatospirillum siberiense TaxID=382514 RepID=A0A2N3PTL3_9PROT|nr:phosphatidylserine decarboxylase [Telmatospirillum siberiense]PKU23733.1 phosphatidylserine decarboxylase family protein [Telmatospirillum siberiense]